ncbi:MAG: glycosyltransferase family A protein [Planctomycetota bacterium]|nr:glycosyltransferase family A protein [Planctomycetota bacterium]
MQGTIPLTSENSPSVSVVLANYNHARFLPRAIESITNQTLAAGEFLIVDDASTDNSVEVLESYAARFPYIKLYRNDSNLGVIKTYQRLFELAQGTYIHPLAADDERGSTFLERAMEMARQFPEAGLIFGDMSIFNEAGELEGQASASAWNEPVYASPDRYLREYLLYEKPSHSLVGASVFRRQPFLDVGWYQAELGSWGDTFSFHAVALQHGACYVPVTFAKWHKQRASYSQQSISDPRNTLAMIHLAARLMRSERFRDRFPESFVREWSKRYRRQVAKEYWRGDHASDRPHGASFWKRFLYRLPRTAKAVSLLWDSGDSTAVGS